MKKRLINLALIVAGAGLWISLSNTARFSIKKWDAKFETVLRHSLSDLGLSNQNLKSSIHSIQKDDKGEWVTYRVSLDGLSKDQIKKLRNQLETSGAKVKEFKDKNGIRMQVKRGERIYQDIHILPDISK